MSLSKTDAEQVSTIAELEVRRYFDHYLTEVFPGQVKAVVDAHNNDPNAHGGVATRFNKLVWIGMGAAAMAGGGIMKAISLLVGV
jgi:hypothetical protein